MRVAGHVGGCISVPPPEVDGSRAVVVFMALGSLRGCDFVPMLGPETRASSRLKSEFKIVDG